jgi:hypothetical protein
MDFIPPVAQPLLLAFAPPWTPPTLQRWLLLGGAASVTPGRRPLSKLVRTGHLRVSGPPSRSQPVFAQRRWTVGGLSPAWASFLLTAWVPQGPVALAGDDTVDEHPGRKVCGQARPRDPGRSAHPLTAGRWGPEGVVLAIVVPFPLARRPWAWPGWVARARAEEGTPAPGHAAAPPGGRLAPLVCPAAVLLGGRWQLGHPRGGARGPSLSPPPQAGQPLLRPRHSLRAAPGPE